MIKESLIKRQKEKKSITCYLAGGHIIPCFVKAIDDSFLVGKSQHFGTIIIKLEDIIGIAYD